MKTLTFPKNMIIIVNSLKMLYILDTIIILKDHYPSIYTHHLSSDYIDNLVKSLKINMHN
jgi:uncharacterized protein (DUF2249 family)